MVDDPWGFGGSLEWATSCPPPRHNFTSIPRIRSERPAFDLHHPEVTADDLVRAENGADKGSKGGLREALGDADLGGTT
jgi:cytochrome c oxidase subunit 1